MTPPPACQNRTSFSADAVSKQPTADIRPSILRPSRKPKSRRICIVACLSLLQAADFTSSAISACSQVYSLRKSQVSRQCSCEVYCQPLVRPTLPTKRPPQCFSRVVTTRCSTTTTTGLGVLYTRLIPVGHGGCCYPRKEGASLSTLSFPFTFYPFFHSLSVFVAAWGSLISFVCGSHAATIISSVLTTRNENVS